MALRVRVSHAAEKKIYELPARAADRPVMVGSGPSASLKVASTSVADVHCVLFVRNGQWMVQKVSSDLPALLNQIVLEGATALRIGDQLILGTDPDSVTLDIDPAAAKAGRSGEPAADSAPTAAKAPTPSAPLTSTQTPQPPVRPATQPPQPPQPRQSAPPPPSKRPPALAASTSQLPTAIASPPGAPPPRRTAAYVPPTRAQVAPEPDGDTIEWEVPAATTDVYASNVGARRAPQGSNTTAIIMCVAAALAIAVIAIAVITMKKSADDAAMKRALAEAQAVPKPPPVDRAVLRKNMFTATSPSSTTQPTGADGVAAADGVRATPRAAGAAAQTSPADAPTTDEAAPDLASGDPEWLEIQSAADSDDQAAALLKFDDYSRKHPQQNVDKLKEFRADGLDRLWWKRLDQLWEKRQRLQKDIAAKERDIGDETNAVFKAQLAKEKSLMETELLRTKATLSSELSNNTERPPNTADPASLAKLRAARNRSQYAAWCQITANYIRTHNGQAPWSGDE